MFCNSLLIYDGLCSLCNWGVKFVLQHEASPDILFVSLQSEAGVYLCQNYKIPSNINSVVFLKTDADHTMYHSQSDVLIFIAPYLKKPWSLLSHVRFVPRFIRDALYNFIAHIRYRIWGKLDICPVPPPAIDLLNPG